MNAEITGKFIQQLRKEQNLTQKDLAKKLNISDKTISRWETGKGYPDIEILPKLGEALGVGISELLEGRKAETQPNTSESLYENNLQTVCKTVKEENVKRKKQMYRLKIALGIICVLMVMSLLVSFFGSRVYAHYNSVVGSDSCVISSDFNELTYFSQKYIPIIIPENSKITAVDEILVDEPMIDGRGFFEKLFIDYTVYSVYNVENNDIIYVSQTGYNGCSNFFCREEKYDYYFNKLGTGEYVFKDCFVDIETESFFDSYKTVKINQQTVSYIAKLANGKNKVSVKTAEKETASEYDLYANEKSLVKLGKLSVGDDGIYFTPSPALSYDNRSKMYKLDKTHSDYLSKILSS